MSAMRQLHKNTHIAVLLGGISSEREVSLNTGRGVIEALQQAGYQHVTPLDAGHDIGQKLRELKPDVVFNALHGRFGEDGCVQGILEWLGIAYTHSGVLASAVGMDKPMAKIAFEKAGIPVAEGKTLHRDDFLQSWAQGTEPMPRPYVIKPLNEGSSVGVEIVREGENRDFSARHWPFGTEVLVEPYIPGREIQVAVLNGKALGAIEIKPKGNFYDYAAKYTAGLAEHLMPAPLSAEETATVHRYAELAHAALGCRGLTRSDFRYDDTQGTPGRWVILEINTQPGMTPLSLSPEIAAHAGISYIELVEHVLEDALCHAAAQAKAA